MSWRDLLASANATQTIGRARSCLGRNTVYHLGGNDNDPAAPFPHQCDCSGFVDWSIGTWRQLPPRSDKWLYTDSIWEGGGEVGPRLFSRMAASQAQPGDFYVYPSPGPHHVGHISIIMEVNGGKPSQGEGWVDDPGRQSHFELFLELHNAWTTPSPPTDIINAAENPWVGPPSSDAKLEELRTTHPESEVLAKAFNLRYERILLLIALTFADGVPATLISTIRSQAVQTDMRSNIGSLAEALLGRSLKEGGIATSVRAGPPFQAPGSLPVDLPGIKARLEAIRAATLTLNNEFPHDVAPIDISPDQELSDQLAQLP